LALNQSRRLGLSPVASAAGPSATLPAAAPPPALL
jgi:hypothetical protein